MNRKGNSLLYLLPMVLIPLVAGLVVITMVNKKAGVSRPEKAANHENSTITKKHSDLSRKGDYHLKQYKSC